MKPPFFSYLSNSKIGQIRKIKCLKNILSYLTITMNIYKRSENNRINYWNYNR